MVRDLTDFHSTGNGNVAKLERVANIMGFNDSVANPFNLIACGFHFIGAVLYIFFYLYDSHVQANCPQPHFYYGSHYTFGGRAKFLTYLCMVSQVSLRDTHSTCIYTLVLLVYIVEVLYYGFSGRCTTNPQISFSMVYRLAIHSCHMAIINGKALMIYYIRT
jgi:hypothetical protein